MYYLIGLGNPGEEYKLSRHNAGRIILADFLKSFGIELELDKKFAGLVGKVLLGKEKVQIIFPETFMNKSGLSLKPIIASAQKGKNLIVVHDDIDLPIGKMKICFGKGAGGHKGVESVIKNIKTKDFIRIRIGVSPVTPKGKLKKPDSEKVVDFIIGNFKSSELEILKKLSKKISSAIEMIVVEGLEKAMNLHNKQGDYCKK